jgi:anti-sigma factor RsiW
MDCRKLLGQLGEYVDGEIDPAICAELEKHLADCDPCRMVVDNLRGTVQIYKDCEPYDVPIRFQEQLHELLQKRWKECHPDDK